MLRPPVRCRVPGRSPPRGVVARPSHHPGRRRGRRSGALGARRRGRHGRGRAGRGRRGCLFDLGRIAAGTVSLAVTGRAAAPSSTSPRPSTSTAPAARAARPARRASATCAAGASPRRSSRRSTSSARATSSPWCAPRTARRHRSSSWRSPTGSGPGPRAPSFECSDPLLDRVHAVGLRTVDLCALDAYVDCPTREQRAWTGDSVVHQMVDLTTNPDWSMAVWHPQLAAAPRTDGMLAMAVASDFAAADQMFIPDWPLHWLHSVHNLYRYTGDRDLVAELLAPAERMMRWFESYLGDDGLLHDVSGWALIDWASVYVSGCSSIINGLWARALEELAEMRPLARQRGHGGVGRPPPRGCEGRLRRVLGRGPGLLRRPRRRRRGPPPDVAARRRHRARRRARARRPRRSGARPHPRPLAAAAALVRDVPVHPRRSRRRPHVRRPRLPGARPGTSRRP